MGRFLPHVTVLVLVLGCSADEQFGQAVSLQTAMQNVCQPQQGGTNTAVVTVNAQGARIEGSVNAHAVIAQDRIAAALYGTKRGEVPISYRGRCVEPVVTPFGWTLVAVPCRRTDTLSLDRVYGRAYAPTMEEAETAAEEACTAMARRWAEANGVRRSHSALSCEPVQKTWC